MVDTYDQDRFSSMGHAWHSTVSGHGPQRNTTMRRRSVAGHDHGTGVERACRAGVGP